VRRLLPLLLLAGCGDTPVGEALRGAVAPAPAPVVAVVPVAGPALLVTGGRRPLAFALVQESGERRLWRAEGGVAIATDGARIVATAGLGPVLAATRFEGPDPLQDPRNLAGRAATARRTVDMQGADRDPGSMRFGLLLECRLTGQAQGGFVVVEERCSGPGGAFTNRFWAEAGSGLVRRSEQWVGPGMPMLTVEIGGF
jgi:hypothetical protein